MFTIMAGHKFQPMACLMFQNQKVTHSLNHSVTRSPIELSAGQLKINDNILI